ncbi:predicted protein [Chaetomium globosum CBS 148.51]|uniref:Uncharacterized protein n=1 Tax=Chaetomium globosum (strain ATCC 6205 / CBS 148.51 / DSM 1962 / NBRC 6347 / NRRL 1970) TaxID=306901 RepID=Q2GU39_CHAGB|nr:uncharacterized protein CHGG_08515 [Chaetomium globosum CBS 148.51]EAQ84501.1 predicted protein [Chaetomium globosum CBS 148.51]
MPSVLCACPSPRPSLLPLEGRLGQKLDRFWSASGELRRSCQMEPKLSTPLRMRWPTGSLPLELQHLFPSFPTPVLQSSSSPQQSSRSLATGLGHGAHGCPGRRSVLRNSRFQDPTAMVGASGVWGDAGRSRDQLHPVFPVSIQYKMWSLKTWPDGLIGFGDGLKGSDPDKRCANEELLVSVAAVKGPDCPTRRSVIELYDLQERTGRICCHSSPSQCSSPHQSPISRDARRDFIRDLRQGARIFVTGSTPEALSLSERLSICRFRFFPLSPQPPPTVARDFRSGLSQGMRAGQPPPSSYRPARCQLRGRLPNGRATPASEMSWFSSHSCSQTFLTLELFELLCILVRLLEGTLRGTQSSNRGQVRANHSERQTLPWWVIEAGQALPHIVVEFETDMVDEGKHKSGRR